MFDFAVTTPANTTKANSQRTELPLRMGVIDLVHVAFPPGSRGLLHVFIERGGSLLWPENEGDGFAWDNFTIVFTPKLQLEAEPFTLVAVTFNEDDTFSHQVNLRFSVLAPEVALPQHPEVSVVEKLTQRLFRRGTGG